MIFIVAWPWHLHGSLHQVHVYALTSSQIARGENMNFSTCAALEFRDEAEAAFILCRCQFIGSGSRISLCDILETRILCRLWA